MSVFHDHTASIDVLNARVVLELVLRTQRYKNMCPALSFVDEAEKGKAALHVRLVPRFLKSDVQPPFPRQMHRLC